MTKKFNKSIYEDILTYLNISVYEINNKKNFIYFTFAKIFDILKESMLKLKWRYDGVNKHRNIFIRNYLLLSGQKVICDYILTS